MRLVDADDLKGKAYPFPCAIGAEYAVTIRAMNEALTIDPIHAAGGCYCRECRYWSDDGRCDPCENGLIREFTRPTDFCSYGQRKDGQDE